MWVYVWCVSYKQMGQQGNSRMRVATLNYSGIFVSPFEFYAMDNWTQLERMGRIFQDNLKTDFTAIKTQIKAVAPDFVPVEDFYTRRRFQWRIEDFDKKYKGKRSSPVYIKDAEQTDLATYNYMGISSENTLHNEVQFKEEWATKNKSLSQQKAQSPQQKQRADFELYMCRRFDFQCYQAIIMYLFSQPQHAHFFQGERRLNEVMKLQDIVRGIEGLSVQRRAEAIRVYREYMAGQFKRIDSPFKIQMTVDYLFRKWDLDVICLQEVDTKLRQRLFEQDKYFVFAPVDEAEDDQCIILLKKKLPLVPPYFAEHYQEEVREVIKVREAAHHAFNDFKSLQRQRGNLVKVIKDHFNVLTSQRIIKKLEQQVSSQAFKKYKDEVLREIFSELMNPKKGKFDNLLEKYKEKFLIYGRERAGKEKKDKDKETMQGYLKELQNKGMLFWTEAFILTDFNFSCLRLQQQQPDPDQRNIFGSLHLSSKQAKNKLQVQLLGIFIYELLVQKYQLVFAGDYNSHIVIGQKQNTDDLFAFLRGQLNRKPAELKKLTDMEKTLHIFPKHPMILTTKKKRTIMQVQARKTNLLAEKSIDQIISNIPILLDQCYTGDVEGLGSGKNNNKVFIPHMTHPYDHFIVEAVLDTSQQRL